MVVSVAVGLWEFDPCGEIPQQHTKAWPNAILNERRSFRVDEIFETRPQLAYEWLTDLISDNSVHKYVPETAYFKRRWRKALFLHSQI